jgi:hypothetical protein
VSPKFGDPAEIEREVAGAQQLEPLRVPLEQRVLDPVVNHLHEVPRAGRANMRVAALGRERGKDRFESRDRIVVPPDHEAVALGQPPDAPRGSRVQKVDALICERAGPRDRVGVARVASIDDGVAAIKQFT